MGHFQKFGIHLLSQFKKVKIEANYFLKFNLSNVLHKDYTKNFSLGKKKKKVVEI